MTTLDETGIKSRALAYIGHQSDLSQDTMPVLDQRLIMVAEAIGVNVQGQTREHAVKIISEGMDALDAVARKPRPDSDLAALNEHIREQSTAFAKFESLQQLLTQSADTVTTNVSVLEQFKFEVTEDDYRVFIVPKGMSVIQVFEILNTEAQRLGICPAVNAADFDWYKKNTKAAEVQSADLAVFIAPEAIRTTGRFRSYGEVSYNRQDMLHMALANALEWIQSEGEINSFVDDRGDNMVLQTNIRGCSLGRDARGVYVFFYKL